MTCELGEKSGVVFSFAVVVMATELGGALLKGQGIRRTERRGWKLLGALQCQERYPWYRCLFALEGWLVGKATGGLDVRSSPYFWWSVVRHS